LPSRHHFRISAGEDRTLSLTARGSGGAILDLTTYSISWSMAHTKGGAPVLQKTGTVVSAVAGTFTISLTDSDTNLLKAGTYFHQALATAGATTLNVAEGNIQVSLENTGVLSSSLGMSYDGTQFYSTRAQAALARINLSVPFVWTAGSASPGDGKGALYRRAGAQPSHSVYFQSADGAYWEAATWGNQDGYRGPLTDLHNGSSVWHFEDKISVGAPSDGSSTGSTAKTFLGDAAMLNCYWAERNATILGVSRFGGGGGVFAARNSDQYTYLGATVWTTGQTVAIGAVRGYQQRIYTAASAGVCGVTPPTHTSGTVTDGAVNWTFTENTYMTPIGMSAFAISDTLDGSGTWASYFHYHRHAGAGTGFAGEVNVKNMGSDIVNDSYNHMPAGSNIGWWMAAGGDAAIAVPANPSTAAIVIGSNGTTWNKGIVFESDGLTADVSGYMVAVSLAQKQLVKGWVSAGVAGANIRSEVSDGARPSQYVFVNDGHQFITRSSLAFLVSNQAGGEPANYIRADAVAASSAVALNALGTDTNIDFMLTPKGSGTVKFGTFTGSADAAVNGYVTIKDAAGNSRKLATIA
jgi:hypothetical protein